MWPYDAFVTPANVPTAQAPNLAGAAAAALSGGPRAVQSLLAQQGIHKDLNYCGEFAAAIVKQNGGTPPDNPQIASNWRNWGSQVQTPQAGDIAVRSAGIHGQGYIPTGGLGSHVTFVGGVDPKGATFTGYGGNQSSPAATFQTGQYQFYRPGTGNQFAQATTQATGMTPAQQATAVTGGAGSPFTSVTGGPNVNTAQDDAVTKILAANQQQPQQDTGILGGMLGSNQSLAGTAMNTAMPQQQPMGMDPQALAALQAQHRGFGQNYLTMLQRQQQQGYA